MNSMMQRVKFFGSIVLLFTIAVSQTAAQEVIVKIYPDSLINDVSNRPIGINLDFLMDGGRFPHPKQTVTQALKEMGVKYLRYPGGEKSDLYLFSVPPYEKSAPALARTAGLEDYAGMFTNEGTFVYDPLDFDEYMSMCHAIGAEPVVVVAADNYLRKAGPGERVSSREELIRNGVEWVRYANMKKKYGVRYWMIGNESWNANNPNSNADIYAQDVIDFSKAMKAVDPSIMIVANGERPEFLKTVVEKTGDYADRLCVSNYGVDGFHRGYKTYRDTAQVLIGPALSGVDALNRYATPGQKKHWKVIVAEFGTIDWFKHWKWDNDMGHAIVNFDMTGQLLLQREVEFSCFWNTRWIENESRPGMDHDALDKDGNLNPTGFALKIWCNFLGKQMVKTEATAPIISYSSYDPGNSRLFIYLINKSELTQKASISITGYREEKVLQAWEYFGTTAEDMKPTWQKRKELTLSEERDLKGASITVFELSIKPSESKNKN